MTVVLRPHRADDLAWIVQRHRELYASEYGWGEPFAAHCAKIVEQFEARFDRSGTSSRRAATGSYLEPAREGCWIADRGGERLGSVLVAEKSADVAQLRMLLVEPVARGLGVGARLVDQCTAFARGAGYRTLMLWTMNVLAAAHRLYVRAGYRMVLEQPFDGFGAPLLEQTWELDLATP